MRLPVVTRIVPGLGHADRPRPGTGAWS